MPLWSVDYSYVTSDACYRQFTLSGPQMTVRHGRVIFITVCRATALKSTEHAVSRAHARTPTGSAMPASKNSKPISDQFVFMKIG